MPRPDEVLREYLALPLLERGLSRATRKALKALETGEASPELVAEVVAKLDPATILRQVGKLPANVLGAARDTLSEKMGWSLSRDVAADVLERYTDDSAWREQADAVASVLVILQRGWGPPESSKQFKRLAEYASSAVADAVARAVDVGEPASALEYSDDDVTWLYLLAEADQPRAEAIWREFFGRERDDHGVLVHHLYLASLHVSAPGFELSREELHALARKMNPDTSYPEPPKAKTRQAKQRGAKGPGRGQAANSRAKRPKQAPGEPAAARLRALTFDGVHDPARDANIAKDLVAARDRLSASERRRIIGGLAKQSPNALLRAARKPLNPEVGAEIVAKLSREKSLATQFFVTAAEQTWPRRRRSCCLVSTRRSTFRSWCGACRSSRRARRWSRRRGPSSPSPGCPAGDSAISMGRAM